MAADGMIYIIMNVDFACYNNVLLISLWGIIKTRFRGKLLNEQFL